MIFLYLGAHPKPSLTRMFDEAGHTIVAAQYSKGMLASSEPCAAVVLHWRSKVDQQAIEEAKAVGVPIMVITSQLAEAYSAGDPLADMYLEEPAAADDIAALLIDMITATSDPRIALSTGTSG